MHPSDRSAQLVAAAVTKGTIPVDTWGRGIRDEKAVPAVQLQLRHRGRVGVDLVQSKSPLFHEAQSETTPNPHQYGVSLGTSCQGSFARFFIRCLWAA